MKKKIYNKNGNSFPKIYQSDGIEIILWKMLNQDIALYRIGYITKSKAIGLICAQISYSERLGKYLYTFYYPFKSDEIKFDNSEFIKMTNDYFSPFAKYVDILAGFNFIIRQVNRYEANI